ncbi:MAG: hypothetical protein IKS68_00215 [Mailhella sp.]|nr:hypothetical protein [Mailhella sp.]
MIFEAPKGYEILCEVLGEAVEQASKGKGKERHARDGEAYESQIICEVARRVGLGYPLGQACKKIYESQRLDPERGIAELLGAINYLAAAVIVMQEEVGEEREDAVLDHDFLVQAFGGKAKRHKGPEFKPGDKVQVRMPAADGDRWDDAECVALLPEGTGIRVDYKGYKGIAFGWPFVRHAPKAEGVEELVVSPFDAPQTKEELFRHIVDCNPATFKAHKPTGEELAEMAEEEGHE